MKIESIGLENIRSHVKSLIIFKDGFNCLVGGVGTGKSSILYAIDFALFGDPIIRSYDYLLREGADVGRVALKFVKDGKEYFIQRVLRRRGEHITQDMEQLKLFEGERVIAEMKSDAVSEQLRSLIGVDKEIFREIIWVQQEHLKDILDLAPRERQKRLDQLFGLSDYEDAWTNIGPVIRWYESERSSLEHDPDILRIEELTVQYNEAVKDLSTKEAEMEELKFKLREAEKKFLEASARWEELENIRRNNERLLKEEAEVRARIAGTKESISRLLEEFESRKSTVRKLEEQLDTLRKQEDLHKSNLQKAGLPSNLTTEQLQEHMSALEGQVSRNLGEEESLRNEIKRSTQRMSALLKENTCPLCLQLLTPEYKERLMNRLYQETAENNERLKSVKKSIEELEFIRDIVRSAIHGFQSIRTGIDYTVRQIESEKRQIDEVMKRIVEKRNEEQIFASELIAIQSKIREIDVEELKAAEKERTFWSDRLSDLKHRAQNLEFQKNEILRRLEALKERLDIAQKKVERIEKVKKILDLAQEIRTAYRSIQPKLRSEFVAYLERIVQQVLDELSGYEGPSAALSIDENYTPIVEGEEGYERSTMNLSGGERTILAFAYRIGVGQLVMQWKAGYGLQILLLDEPTESLGREDGSIDRLAESLSRLRTVEQVIAVTHSEAFAERAEHVIRLEKRDNQSIVSVER